MSNVSKRWIGSVVLLLALAGLCFGITNWRTENMIASAYESCGDPAPIRMSELSLTSAQKEKIDSLQTAYRGRITDLCMKHCEQKRKLADLLVISPRNDEDVLACSAEVARLQTEAEQATTQHILAVAGVMKPQQAEVFLQKFSKEIVKTCPLLFAPEAK